MQEKHWQMVERASEEIAVADAAMWSGLRSAKHRNPMGCRTFLFELFAGRRDITTFQPLPSDLEMLGDGRTADVVGDRTMTTGDAFGTGSQ